MRNSRAFWSTLIYAWKHLSRVGEDNKATNAPSHPFVWMIITIPAASQHPQASFPCHWPARHRGAGPGRGGGLGVVFSPWASPHSFGPLHYLRDREIFRSRRVRATTHPTTPHVLRTGLVDNLGDLLGVVVAPPLRPPARCLDKSRSAINHLSVRLSCHIADESTQHSTPWRCPPPYLLPIQPSSLHRMFVL